MEITYLHGPAPLYTNSYIALDGEGAAVVIDPAAGAGQYREILEKKGAKLAAILLTAVDGNGRPLFINNVAEGAVPMILSAPVRQSKGAYIANTASTDAVVGFAGDWTQAMYGTVEDVQITIADQATLTDSSGTINLFEQNMFAVRAEIEVGFRCDTTVFNKLTGAAKTGG